MNVQTEEGTPPAPRPGDALQDREVLVRGNPDRQPEVGAPAAPPQPADLKRHLGYDAAGWHLKVPLPAAIVAVLDVQVSGWTPQGVLGLITVRQAIEAGAAFLCAGCDHALVPTEIAFGYRACGHCREAAG